MSVLNIHRQAAQHLFGVSYYRITDEQLDRAKRINYALAYKSSPALIAAKFGVREDRVRSWKKRAPHRLRSVKCTRPCWKCGKTFHRLRTLMRHVAQHSRHFTDPWWRDTGRRIHAEGEQLARDFIARITTP